MDDQDALSAFLHIVSPLAPGGWIRTLAQTHVLDITAQLDNGIRYIDFRMMEEPILKTWYSLHFVQSNNVVEVYFKSIRQWLDAHPSEIVVIQCSKHGNAWVSGNEAYPGVSNADRQTMWNTIEGIFSGLLIDTRVSRWNETPLSDLVERNHRAIFLMGDYHNFTNSSPFAYDSTIINQGGMGNVWAPADGYSDAVKQLTNMEATKEGCAAQGQFLMHTMANAVSTNQVESLAYIHFLPIINKQKHIDACAAELQIPGAHFCPESLLDLSQLLSYYNQQILEYAFEQDLTLPMAIIHDAIDFDGTIRTSSDKLTSPSTSSTRRYAYVDTILAINLRKACKATPTSDTCTSLTNEVALRRSKYPFLQWNEPSTGRLTGWPAVLPPTIKPNMFVSTV